MSLRAALGLALVPVLLAVAGCTAVLGRHAEQPSATSSSGSQHQADATTAASPSLAPNPTLTPTEPASTPLGAGQRVWAAFSQRSLPYAAWWARLSPMLSDAARAVYVYDDPRHIPAMTLTGTIHLAAKAPDQAGYTAEVIVPTSKGDFALDLERHTLTSPWLLYSITFPHGVQ